jgi:hypothetical protein
LPTAADSGVIQEILSPFVIPELVSVGTSLHHHGFQITHADKGERAQGYFTKVRDLLFLPKFSPKNIVIPSKEIPFFGKAHHWFWAIIAKFGFFSVIQMARITKFSYSGDPNNRITEYLVIRVTQTERLFG